MVKVKFNKIFILGLYAYLRQVELSLDRVLFDSWGKLILYFEDKIKPQEVINYLEKITENKVKIIIFSKKIVFHNNIFDSLFFFGKYCYLSESDIFNIRSLLKTFSILIQDMTPPDKDKLIELRMQLNSLCHELEGKLPKKNIQKAQYVEHFNQNKCLHCISLEEIVGEEWLDLNQSS